MKQKDTGNAKATPKRTSSSLRAEDAWCDDKQVEKFTKRFINRYREALQALADK
ncbi:MAG: hypothetical protein Q7R88_01030 [bacterium]|nr:hypothetical protein [bacterium]